MTEVDPASRLEQRPAYDPLAIGCLLFAPLAWASNIIVGRALADSLAPEALNVLRWLGTCGLLMPVFLWHLRRHSIALLHALPHMLAAGVVGLGLFQILLYSAVSRTEATHAAAALALSPLIALLARGRGGSPRAWRGFWLSFIGVIFVQSGSIFQDGLTQAMILGDGVAILAAVVWGIYSVLAARLPVDVPPLSALFVMSLAATVVSLPGALWGEMPDLLQVGALTWAAIGHLVVVVSIAGLAAYNVGIARIGAERGSLSIHLTPAFTAALAMIFLGEPIGWVDLVGFLVIFAGLFHALGPRTI